MVLDQNEHIWPVSLCAHNKGKWAHFNVKLKGLNLFNGHCHNHALETQTPWHGTISCWKMYYHPVHLLELSIMLTCMAQHGVSL